MKKFLLLGFFLMGCSDVDNEKKQLTIEDAVEQSGVYIGAGGGTGNSKACNGEVEVREFELNGEKFFLEIPINCAEDWQLLEDPENNVVEDPPFEGRVGLDN